MKMRLKTRRVPRFFLAAVYRRESKNDGFMGDGTMGQNGAAVMAALCAEAKRRGTSYGKLIAATTEEEREEIVAMWEAGARKRGREPRTEQCRRCVYWKNVGGGTTAMACHCMQDTGHGKAMDGELCRSRETEGKKKKRVCVLAATEKSTLAGYKV